VLGYELWRDDGLGGDYFNLYNILTNLGTGHTDKAVVVGRLYRYIYRARNLNGFGEFSDPGYLYAASPPSKPAPPTLMNVDTDSITLQLHTPLSTGGSPITSYQLYIDEGELNSDFSEVVSYTQNGGATANLLVHTLTVATDNLVTGQIYTFKFRAANSVGYSEFSQFTRVGLGKQSESPTSLSSDTTQDGPTFLQLNWSLVPDSDLPTLGYSVEFFDDDDLWKTIFDASSNPDAL
jgi:hypothetical protein